jgi:hypothetical protein
MKRIWYAGGFYHDNEQVGSNSILLPYHNMYFDW